MIRLDLLGDLVFSMPSVALLRDKYPAARIVMLTLPYTASLARMYDCVDEVVAVDTNLIRSPSGLANPATWVGYARVLRHLRACHFDLSVSVSGRMASLCAFLSGARWTIGYDREAYPHLLTDSLPGGRYVERTHEVKYGRALAMAAGARDLEVCPRPRVPEEATVAVVRTLHDAGIAEGDRVIAIHLGAGNGSAKRWPLSHWIGFVDALHGSMSARCVVVGGAGDKAAAADLIRNTHYPPVSLVGQTDIVELTAVLARSALVVSGDSGPLHLAAALGRPVIGVYGPTDPLVYGPGYGSGPSLVLRQDLPCSPCYTAATSAECPLGDPICMRLVTVERVVAAVRRMLDEASTHS